MGFFDFLNKQNSVSTDNSFQDLKESFSKTQKEAESALLKKHASALSVVANYPTQLVAGAFGGLMLLTNNLPVSAAISQSTVTPPPKQISRGVKIDPSVFLISDLQKVLPDNVQPLTPEEEKEIAGILSGKFKMKVSAELDGIRLNRSYGLIGAEQHLSRYPGDNMATHFDNPDDREKYSSSGMAPGLGAWGYFSKSKQDMTQKDIDREKYYIAVQTFLAPGFHNNVYKYITFFKYRKMLVVNPQNGKAMVVVIGDAGPGQSTGKHLGGSPEVMKYLERADGKQRGPVLYLFIDDSEDKIPLGPIEPK